MSAVFKPRLSPIAKNPLIDAASEIAEAVYAILPQFPDSEKWDAATRLHQGSNYLLNNVARAVANSSPTGTEFDWGAARKEAAAVLTMLRFAIKQRFIDKAPMLPLKLNDLIKEIDKETEAAYERHQAYEQYELSLWQDKYEMWKKLNREIKK